MQMDRKYYGQDIPRSTGPHPDPLADAMQMDEPSGCPTPGPYSALDAITALRDERDMLKTANAGYEQRHIALQSDLSSARERIATLEAELKELNNAIGGVGTFAPVEAVSP